jgi:DNA-directed RNA polymerase subunit RPC12/RpoP
MALLISSTLRLVYNIEVPLQVCSNCGSTKTSNSHWYRDGKSGYQCHPCHMKLVYNPRWHPITNPKRINFKGKQVFLDEAPRKGVCSLCGIKVGQFHPVTGHYCKTTHMHHLQYDPENPANYTIEVCVPCHRQEHQRLKTIGNGENGPIS